LILIIFEDILGIKINFDKYEMVPLNISDEQGLHLANYLGCKLTHLSITYLGLPLHFKKLIVEHCHFLIENNREKDSKLE
jgi:hypothetical protein